MLSFQAVFTERLLKDLCVLQKNAVPESVEHVGTVQKDRRKAYRYICCNNHTFSL